MRPQGNTASGVWLQTFDNVLLKPIIGTALWGSSPNVSSEWVIHEFGLAPTFYGVRRIGHYYIKLLELVIFQNLRLVKRITLHNQEFVNRMHEHVHPCNGRSNQVEFLSVQFQVSVFLALFLQVQSRVQ